MSLVPLADLPKKGITYSRNHIDRLIKDDRFPRPIFLSPRKRAFEEAEIDAWIRARVEASREKIAAEKEARDTDAADTGEVAA